MAFRYGDLGKCFVPEATGQVVNPEEIPGGLELLFGEHADEVRAMLEQARKRPPNRYVQVVKPLPELHCPKCGSENIEVGGFPLRCLACGWHYLQDNPCSVCGAPATSVVGDRGVVRYGCKDHPALEQM